ncbi:hypothetical protein EDD11_007840 [Mortierella claussenii]|nr:hypothetical protein EDD11_007840 [Mortierella claussenii]
MRVHHWASLPLATAMLATSSMAARSTGPEGSGPYAAMQMRSGFIENKFMFVNDGFSYSDLVPQDVGPPTYYMNPLQQFYSLDLSVPWTSATAPWKNLTAQRPNSVGTSQYVVAQDQSRLLFLSDSLMEYTIANDSWRAVEGSEYFGRAQKTQWVDFGKGAVMDEDNGILYGFGSPSRNNVTRVADGPWKLTEVDLVKNTSQSTLVTMKRPDPFNFMSTVWSHEAKALYMYEWNAQPQPGPEHALMKYDIASRTWTVVSVTGDLPPNRAAPCMVPAYGGKKLILVGGQTYAVNGSLSRSDTYLFDTTTSVWQKVASAPRGYSSSTCAVSGDMLIVFGGYSYDMVQNKDGPAVYNMATNTWGTHYVPNTSAGPSTNVSSGGSNDDGKPSAAVAPPRPWTRQILGAGSLIALIASALLL